MKGIAPIVIFVILAAAVVGILYVTGVGLNGLAALTGAGCANGYEVTDYHFVACVEDPANHPIITLSTAWFQCPTVTGSINGCMVRQGHAKVCSTSSGTNCDGLFTPFSRIVNVGAKINPGEWVYVGDQYSNSVQVEEYYATLTDCGINTGTCANGAITRIPGSSFCQFNTDGSVYDENGNIANAKAGAFAYTVPFGRTYTYPDRSYCITVPKCNTNADCANAGRYQGIYNGQTISYTVSGTHLSIYQCVQTTVAKTAMESQNLTTQTIGMCQAVGKDVGCQPQASSCGANSCCKDMGNLNFQCSTNCPCTTNADCGNTIGDCDVSTLTINSHVCQAGVCIISKQNLPSGGCCDDVNCQVGYYCGQDHKCYQGGNTKTVCPYQCCIGLTQYIDRQCTTGQVCCSDNSCKTSCEGVCQNIGETCNALAKCCPGESCISGFFGLSPLGTCQKTGAKDWFSMLFDFITWFIILTIVFAVILVVAWMMTPLKFVLKPKMLIAVAIVLGILGAFLLTMIA